MLERFPARATLTLVALVWIFSVAAAADRLHATTLPIAATCLEEEGAVFPRLAVWYFAMGGLLSRFWLFVYLPLAVVAVAPRSKPFTFVPVGLLGAAALFQVVSFWATVLTAEASVGCLRRTIIRLTGVG